MRNEKSKLQNDTADSLRLSTHFAFCNLHLLFCICPAASPSRRQPRGISLLEVLFAIFVLAVGLLGLAAMVPVGKFQVSEANHADRSVAIGLAAHREIKVRDYLDAEGWTFYNFSNSAFEAFVPA